MIDAAQPDAMRIMGISPSLPQAAESIQSDGAGRLFVCCGTGGLVILDASAPSTPIILTDVDYSTVGGTEPGEGNPELKAPAVKTARNDTIAGKTYAYGRVEIYLYADGEATPLGTTDADADGAFTYTYQESLKGEKVLLLVTDPYSNASAFSKAYTVKSKQHARMTKWRRMNVHPSILCYTSNTAKWYTMATQSVCGVNARGRREGLVTKPKPEESKDTCRQLFEGL